MLEHQGFRRNVANRILAALPEEQYQRLLPHLELLSLDFKYSLYKPNKLIEFVYFPLSGVMSLVTIMDDGIVVEIGTVGNEGMMGLPVFLGAECTPGKAFCQVPGEVLRMKSDAFKAEIKHNGALTDLLHRYTQALFNQIAQSAACNRLHAIEERCARWILMTHDRVAIDEFPLTQEFLGQMLGVRRPSVNVAARLLQQAGLIRYSRGKITVTDRKGLESASCECYAVIKAEYERLIGA